MWRMTWNKTHGRVFCFWFTQNISKMVINLNEILFYFSFIFLWFLLILSREKRRRWERFRVLKGECLDYLPVHAFYTSIGYVRVVGSWGNPGWIGRIVSLITTKFQVQFLMVGVLATYLPYRFEPVINYKQLRLVYCSPLWAIVTIRVSPSAHLRLVAADFFTNYRVVANYTFLNLWFYFIFVLKFQSLHSIKKFFQNFKPLKLF